MSNPHAYLEPWRPADYLMSGEHDPADFDHTAGAYYRPSRSFGLGRPAPFAGGRPVAAHGRRRWPTRCATARELVGATVRSVIDRTVRLEPVDPRWLPMSQSGVTADGVRYYMEQDRYRRCGITYADQDKAGNRVTMILQRTGRHPALRRVGRMRHRAWGGRGDRCREYRRGAVVGRGRADPPCSEARPRGPSTSPGRRRQPSDD